jgi:hypothetical protein
MPARAMWTNLKGLRDLAGFENWKEGLTSQHTREPLYSMLPGSGWQAYRAISWKEIVCLTWETHRADRQLDQIDRGSGPRRRIADV